MAEEQILGTQKFNNDFSSNVTIKGEVQKKVKAPDPKVFDKNVTLQQKKASELSTNNVLKLDIDTPEGRYVHYEVIKDDKPETLKAWIKERTSLEEDAIKQVPENTIQPQPTVSADTKQAEIGAEIKTEDGRFLFIPPKDFIQELQKERDKRKDADRERNVSISEQILGERESDLQDEFIKEQQRKKSLDRNRNKSIEMFNIFVDYYNLHTPEEIARCWNGGPRGINNPYTLGYWNKVEIELEEGYASR